MLLKGFGLEVLQVPDEVAFLSQLFFPPILLAISP
ncbi:hypothetical protein X802_00040 [Thermococcus guaymasensis DSM 11113]|uniref:Uncharacterized protein n=1 Tax=Thermococcus guaymasensis DSM 11113 TaxID=1432656 RepID=A0A0X1KMY8_9EURY|nr:hypothetical protein X802_00040 [Thermococcus guaymasensis DSM 11113]